MISQLNSSAIRSAYTNNFAENKNVGEKAGANVSSQGDMSKIERIKESLESGEYKVNLQALSERIADELL